MLDQKYFRELFYDALQIHRKEYAVQDNRIVKAIASLQEEYAPKNWNHCHGCKPLNFNDAAFRCAYLHKYASCHASLVHFAAERIGRDVFVKIFENVPVAKICCIGGGPGTEVFGLCALLCSLTEFSSKAFHFDIVDCMIGWKTAFASVLQASFKYGSFGSFMSCFTSMYLEANMLSKIPKRVQESISTADLVIMVKFVSAAASSDTPQMLTKVFTLMKPGATVLFIDNAGGEFYELVLNAASRCGFSSHCRSFRHMKYEHEAFRRKMFGFFAASCITVAVQMWEKKSPVTLNAYESYLISKQLVDLEADVVSGCPSRNPENQNGNRPTKSVRRNRRRTRKRRAASGLDGNTRSNSSERSYGFSETVCNPASQQPRKSKSLENSPSISEREYSQYLMTESSHVDIHSDSLNLTQRQCSDSPTTSSTIAEDSDTCHRPSESVSDRDHRHSHDSPRDRNREEDSADCCCVVS